MTQGHRKELAGIEHNSSGTLLECGVGCVAEAVQESPLECIQRMTRVLLAACLPVKMSEKHAGDGCRRPPFVGGLPPDSVAYSASLAEIAFCNKLGVCLYRPQIT